MISEQEAVGVPYLKFQIGHFSAKPVGLDKNSYLRTDTEDPFLNTQPETYALQAVIP